MPGATCSQFTRRSLLLGALLAVSVPALSAPPSYVGSWALTIPGDHAGWLGVTEKDGGLSADMLWGWGSVEHVDKAVQEGDNLVLTRVHRWQERKEGQTIRHSETETITAHREGDNLHLTTVTRRENGTDTSPQEFTGKFTPPPGPAPDLSKVRFGRPIRLLDGRDLTGWRLLEPDAASGWSIVDGALVNNPVQEAGKPHKNYGNLRTDNEYGDFNLQTEVSVPKGGNSGIYLRGIYEVQVAETYGQPVDSHNMGAVYSRITPTEAAEKPADEWQTIDITLVKRHVTVVLNGKKIIDNQPVLGCTGGALWSDPFKPGPIYLQGDHSRVRYRNMVLRPVVSR